MKKKFSFLVVIAALFAALGTGCNTTRGLGEDIEKAGEEIKDAAK